MKFAHIQAACVTAVLISSPSAWAIYKCTDIGGKVSFQEVPCATTDKAAEIKLTPPATSSVAASTQIPDWKRDSLEVDKRVAIRLAIDQHRPAIGMNMEELGLALGLPDAVNSGVYPTGSSQQRVYYHQIATWYVYTNNGIVSSIQSAQGGLGRAQKKIGPCPSGQEIRNVETSASSISLTDAQRADYAAQLKEMRACGR